MLPHVREPEAGLDPGRTREDGRRFAIIPFWDVWGREMLVANLNSTLHKQNPPLSLFQRGIYLDESQFKASCTEAIASTCAMRTTIDLLVKQTIS